MNFTVKIAATLLALAGAAFPQAAALEGTFQRGSLIHPDPAATLNRDRLNFYNSEHFLYSRDYNNCIEKENKKKDPNPYACQHKADIATDYAKKAAAEQAKPERQYSTANQSQTVQNAWSGLIPGLRVPVVTVPSNAAAPVPRMPRFGNNGGGFRNYSRGRVR